MASLDKMWGYELRASHPYSRELGVWVALGVPPPPIELRADVEGTTAALHHHRRRPPGTYYVRIRARNEAGVGPPSAEIVVRVP